MEAALSCRGRAAADAPLAVVKDKLRELDLEQKLKEVLPALGPELAEYAAPQHRAPGCCSQVCLAAAERALTHPADAVRW